MPHGYGKAIYTNKTFIGEWYNGLFHGEGQLNYTCGKSYTGSFMNNF